MLLQKLMQRRDCSGVDAPLPQRDCDFNVRLQHRITAAVGTTVAAGSGMMAGCGRSVTRGGRKLDHPKQQAGAHVNAVRSIICVILLVVLLWARWKRRRHATLATTP
jgi:hypothetical protein